MSEVSRVALLVGAGDAIGAAVARRFAAGGYKVCIARRDPSKSQAVIDELAAVGRGARAYGIDARRETEVRDLCEVVERDVGPIEVCLFNAGANVQRPLIETTDKPFFKAWELASLRGRPPAFAEGRDLPLSRPLNLGCVQLRSRWPANWGRRISMWFTSFWTAVWTARRSINGSRRRPVPSPGKYRPIAWQRQLRSRKLTGSRTRRLVTPGLVNWTFVLQWRLGDVGKPHTLGRRYVAYRP